MNINANKWSLKMARHGSTYGRFRFVYQMNEDSCQVFVAKKATKSSGSVQSIRCLRCLNIAKDGEDVVEREVDGLQLESDPLANHLPQCQPFAAEQYCLSTDTKKRHMTLSFHRIQHVNKSLLYYRMPNARCYLFRKYHHAATRGELAACYSCEVLNESRTDLNKEFPLRGRVIEDMLNFNPSINHVSGCEAMSIDDIRAIIPAKKSRKNRKKAIPISHVVAKRKVKQEIVDRKCNANTVDELRRMPRSETSVSPELGIPSISDDDEYPPLLYGKAMNIKREVIDINCNLISRGIDSATNSTLVPGKSLFSSEFPGYMPCRTRTIIDLSHFNVGFLFDGERDKQTRMASSNMRQEYIRANANLLEDDEISTSEDEEEGRNAELPEREFVDDDPSIGSHNYPYLSTTHHTDLREDGEISPSEDEAERLSEHQRGCRSDRFGTLTEEALERKPMVNHIHSGGITTSDIFQDSGSQLGARFTEYENIDHENMHNNVYIKSEVKKEMQAERVANKGVEAVASIYRPPQKTIREEGFETGERKPLSAAYCNEYFNEGNEARSANKEQCDADINLEKSGHGHRIITRRFALSAAERELDKPLSFFKMSIKDHEEETEVPEFGIARRKRASKQNISYTKDSSDGSQAPSDDTDEEFQACSSVRRPRKRRVTISSAMTSLEIQRKEKCQADRRARYNLRRRASEGGYVSCDPSVNPATISLFETKPTMSVVPPTLVDPPTLTAPQAPFLWDAEYYAWSEAERRREEQVAEAAELLWNLPEDDFDKILGEDPMEENIQPEDPALELDDDVYKLAEQLMFGDDDFNMDDGEFDPSDLFGPVPDGI